VPIEGKLALLPSDDGFDGTVGVVRDISERRERERKLDRLRDRTRALSYTETETETARVATEAADDIIGAPLSGVHLVNDAGDAIVPCAAVESVVETFGDPPTYSRDAEPGSRAAIVWDVFESGDPIRVDDTDSFDRLDEESPSGSVLIHPLGDHGVFIVSAPEAGAFDDTDEALVELLATSLRTGLDRVEREATLRRQRDRLRERNERLDQFTSVVSHDLRNPLDVAQGRLALVREEFEDDRGHLAEVAAAHDRMATLIDDVLALARQGESVSDVQPVNLASLAEGCWRSVATESGTMAVSTDRVVYADRTQLQRLLENLFRNAVEHAGEDVTVTVGDLEDGFYVADDGPGIPPEHRESAFETGYSTTDDGTGFGLAIVEGIADAHGWDVRLAEGSDGGARIEVTGLDRERE
jgi:signal transduction histidine kinase